MLQNCDISTPIQQKQPFQTPAVVRFRDTYAPTLRQYVSTEPKTRLYQ